MRPPIVSPKPDDPKQKELFNQEYDRIMGSGDSFPANSRLDQSVGSYLTGPSKPNLGDLIQSREQWGNDPYSYGKPFSYGDANRHQDFDKYYSRSDFKKLGYDPHRDNEAVYNENSSWLGDFGRAIPQIIHLAGVGFRDMATEWTDWGGKPDVQHAAEMQKALQLGSSTRGGVGGWVTNFALNTAYTMGVMAELVGEELAFTGLTAAAGGLDLPATGALGIARGAAAASKIGSFAKATRAWAEAFKVIRTPEQATAFYKAATATGKFLNPLERTAEFAGEFSKLKGMDNWAKASRGAMALFGDIRMGNAVTSESKLEGGFSKIDTAKELTDLFYNGDGTPDHPAHNRLPNEEEARVINEIADRNAHWGTMINIPLIYLTNKVVFDGAMKGFKVLRDSAAETAAREAAGKLGKVIASGKLVGKYTLAGAKELFKPGMLLKGTLKYTSKNLMEGLQETAQDVVHNALADYYKQVYKDPTLSVAKASFGRGLLSQVSAQGLDTFMQGYLMGGAIGAVQHPLFTVLPTMGRKIFGDTKTATRIFGQTYTDWKSAKETYVNNFVNIYNEIRKNPKKYVDSLNSTDENFVAQQVFNDYLKTTFNPKTTMDLKDESAFHHVYNMLQNGQYDTLKDLVHDFKQMSPDQLEELFGKDKDNLNMTPRQRLDNFDKKLGIIKNLWDDHIRTHPNPISPEQARQSENAFNFYQEFEMYRKIALFAHYSFERAADRSSSILEQAAKNKPLSKASASDFTVLYSPTDLKDHLKALRQEISVLKGSTDTQAKSSLKSKQDRLDILIQYQEVAKQLQKALKSSPDKVEQLNEELHKHYSKYLRTIADEYDEPLLNSKTDETFISVKDFYANHQDRLDMARAVNMFSDPNYIQELLNRLHDVKQELNNQQVDLAKEGLLTAIDKIKNNALLNELFNQGILIAENDPFVEGKAKAPKMFYNASDHQVVSPETFKKAQEIVKTWLDQTSEIKPPPVVSEPPPVNQDLDTKLRNAFFLENVRRKADDEPILHSFDDFVANNSIARDIIANIQPVPVTTQEPEVVDDSKIMDILPEFLTSGQIIYVTPTLGKSWSVAHHSDQLADADELLFDFIKRKKIPGAEDTTAQKAGQVFYNYFKFRTPAEKESLLNEFITEVKEVAKTKTVLTGNWMLMPHATSAFILENPDITIDKDLKAMKQIKKNLMQRDKSLTAKDAESQAYGILQKGESTFKNNKNIPVTIISPGVTMEDILTGVIPEVRQDNQTPAQVDLTDRLDKVTTLSELDTLSKELVKDIEDGKLSSDQARSAVEAKRQQLITDVSFDRIKKGDILIMTDKERFGDKGYGQVVEVSDESIRVRKWWPGIKPTAATEGKTIAQDNLKQEVSLIYDIAMTDEDITPAIDPASEEVAKENIEPTEDLKSKVEARKKNQAKNDDLPNKEDC